MTARRAIPKTLTKNKHTTLKNWVSQEVTNAKNAHRSKNLKALIHNRPHSLLPDKSWGYSGDKFLTFGDNMAL